MISVLLNWLYIGATSFFMGFAVLSLFTRMFSYKVKSLVSVILAGLTFETVYAQIYSLFAGVSLNANILMILLCIITAFLLKNDISIFLYNKFLIIKEKPWAVVAYSFLFLLFLYGTSRGYMHFDTGLYHAQSIRWIEEYGVVKGLANLHIRFAYNSASFALNALYSMKFIANQSLHTTAGFLAFLSSILAIDIYKIFRIKNLRLSDFCRIALFYYLTVIYKEMVSPASDYYAQLLIFDIFILWLAADEEQMKGIEKHNAAPYALLSILLVFALSIKFSIGLLLLLVIKPAVMLLKKKDVKQIIMCIFSGCIIILPFLIRNVIISGWLIYPSTLFDLFSFEWKIPKGQAKCDALEIGAYGKAINDVAKWNTPLKVWVINWFNQLKSIERFWVLFAFTSLLCGVILLLFYIIKGLIKKKYEIEHINFMLIFTVLTISTLFWFFSAPLIRYGYAYVTLLPMYTFGYIYNEVYKKYLKLSYCIKISDYVLKLLIIIFFIFLVKILFNDIKTTAMQNYYIYQEDYIDGDAKTYDVDGITIYVPLNQGQIGYNKFPSSPIIQNIEIRGKSIKDGFRQKGD